MMPSATASSTSSQSSHGAPPDLTERGNPSISKCPNFPNTKTVFFLRHGVAQHNVVPSDSAHNAPHLLDASLTQDGLKQAYMTGVKFANYLRDTVTVQSEKNNQHLHHKYDHSLPVETIFCSPLSRCCETAITVASVAEQTYTCHSQGGSQLPWQNQEQGQFTPRKHPQIVCNELLREAHGINIADRRRSKSYLQSKFGHDILFDPTMSEEDVWWKPSTRETLVDVQKRIHQFFTWLARGEISKQLGSSILIVSHGVWIECCLRQFCPEALNGGRRVYNCDLFRGELQLTNACSSSTESSYDLTNIHFVSSGSSL